MERAYRRCELKSYYVGAFFPEVRPAHCSEQSVVVIAANLAIAARRGMSQLRKREGVRGKRVTTVKLTIREMPASNAGEAGAS